MTCITPVILSKPSAYVLFMHTAVDNKTKSKLKIVVTMYALTALTGSHTTLSSLALYPSLFLYIDIIFWHIHILRKKYFYSKCYFHRVCFPLSSSSFFFSLKKHTFTIKYNVRTVPNIVKIQYNTMFVHLSVYFTSSSILTNISHHKCVTY